MLKIFVTLLSVDHHGLNGRDFHPEDAEIGSQAVVVKMYFEQMGVHGSTNHPLNNSYGVEFKAVGQELAVAKEPELIQLFDCIYINGPRAGELVTLAAGEVEITTDLDDEIKATAAALLLGLRKVPFIQLASVSHYYTKLEMMLGKGSL